MRRLLCLIALVGLVAGQFDCSLYSDPDGPLYGGGETADYELRNPATGRCELWLGTRADDACGGANPAVVYSTAPGEVPDWGTCDGDCSAFDEAGCLAASCCRAAYTWLCPEGEVCSGLQYHGCWMVAPSGPASGGGCDGLDAYECSRHDDCAARHFARADHCVGDDCGAQDETLLIGDFESCVDE